VTVSISRIAGVAGGLAALLALGACGAAPTAQSAAGANNAATATSVKDFGGMDALVAAAKKEGTLNAIALPRDWANYGALIDGFTAKYGIKVQDESPDGSSQDEINAVSSRKGQGRAPDVLDVGSSFALSAAQQGLLASYQVASFGSIPTAQSDPKAQWYQDYGGYVSIGCDAKRVAKCPTTFAELLNPAYKGKVALNGNPTQAAAAFSAVYAAALANGGSFDNIQPGLDYFAKLKTVGNFNPVEAKPATIESGETPITIDWDYLNSGYTKEFKSKGVDWQVSVPSDGKYAPHPAVARLWEEYLYSVEGQNLWLKGYARPVLMATMAQKGTLDSAAAAQLPTVTGTPSFPTDAQQGKAKQLVAQGWSKAIGA